MSSFIPMEDALFEVLVSGIIATNDNQQQAIQSALLQATFSAFSVDYRTAGKDGGVDYDAPRFNAIMDLLENARGVDVDAIARWITAFAPVQCDKATGYFAINKQKVDKLALYLLENPEDKANAFWAWAITAQHKARKTGANDEAMYSPTLNWYELDSNTKARAKAAFTSNSIETRLSSLIKDCIKTGMDDAAELLMKIKGEAVAAAKMAELKHVAE